MQENMDAQYPLSGFYPELSFYQDIHNMNPTNTLANYAKGADKEFLKKFKRHVNYNYPWSSRKENVVSPGRLSFILTLSCLLFLEMFSNLYAM